MALERKGGCYKQQTATGSSLDWTMVGSIECFSKRISYLPRQAVIIPSEMNWPRQSTTFLVVGYNLSSTVVNDKANLTLRATTDHLGEDCYAVVHHSLFGNLYVDDCLTSLQMLEGAQRSVTGATDTLSRGRSRLIKWVSKDSRVMPNLSDERKSSTKKAFDGNVVPFERTLGIWWDERLPDRFDERFVQRLHVLKFQDLRIPSFNAVIRYQTIMGNAVRIMSVKADRIRRHPVLVPMILECFYSFAVKTADLILLRSNEGFKFETQLREWYKYRWKYTSLFSRRES